MKLKIGQKVVLTMFVVVLSIMLMIALYSYSMTKDILIHQVERELSEKNDNVQNTVSFEFEKKGEIIRQLASIPVIESFMSANEPRENARENKDYMWVQQVLTNTQEENEDFHLVWLANPRHNYFISDHDYVSDETYSIETRPWYVQALQNEGTTYSSVYRDYFTEELTISISEPVVVNEVRLGYFGAYIHLDTLTKLIEPLETEHQKIILVSKEGDVLFGSESLWSEIEQVGYKNDELFNLNYGESYYVSMEELDALGWKIGVYVPEKVILASLIKYEKSIIITWIIAIIILLTVLSLILHYFLKDIPFIVRQIHKIKLGDFNISIDIKKKDEVGEIAQAVKQMAAQINNQIGALDFQANYDSLTGLANRNLIEKVLQQWMNEVDTHKEMILVAFLDLDQFKHLNDSKGHAYGDELLIQVGKRVKENLPENSFFGRFGGDEFILIIRTKIEQKNQAFAALQHIHDSIANPYFIFGHQIYTTASMGISFYPYDADTIGELLKAADMALFHAKDLGRNCISYYKLEMKDQIDKELRIRDGLREALINEEFYLQYQPQLDVSSGKMIGVEALIRWRHPKLGFVSPADFIPLAEKTGQIVAIGDWVLDKSLQMMKRMVEQNVSLDHVAVNISSIQLREVSFVEKVKEKLTYYNIEPSLLEIEITESVIMDYQDDTIEKLEQLKALGIQIALDDFGTGYSSLNYLRLMPIDRVKVDKSFIDKIEEDVIVQSILNTIVTLGHSLGFKIVAEGVENEKQLDMVAEMKVDTVQGYYYSKPLDEENLIEFSKK